MRKSINLLLLGLLIYSCDPSQTIELDKTIAFDSVCGEIKIEGELISYHSLVIRQFFEANNYIVNIDELKFDDEILNKSFIDKQGRKLLDTVILNPSVILTRVYLKKSKMKGDVIKILPCNYLECNGKSVIIDTISIIVK
jgi:hypothetical protein